jgi:tetratricopeptide (TPR) repeat protein
MKRINSTISVFVLLFVLALFAGGRELHAATFTSMWSDYEVTVPDGWRVTYDWEQKHYANTHFTSPESGYILSIRWYCRYTTHRLIDDRLEMYAGADDFIQQFSNWYGAANMLEQSHEVTVAGQKAQRFAGRFVSAGQGQNEDYVLSRRAKLGGKLVEDSMARNSGKQIWTLVNSPSGFYVLAYFAPDDKYDKYYDKMVSSFVLLKDGPGGAAMQNAPVSSETANDKLQRYVSVIQSQRDEDLKGPTCSHDECVLFTHMDLREDLIKFVSAMKPAPAVPSQAQRAFIQGNTILKSVGSTEDYQPAIDKYREALIEAPWWGVAYNNLAIALNAAKHYDLAKQAMELYILTNPADAAQAQQKIYEFETKQELKEKHDAALKAKYGGGQGTGFGWESLYRYGAVVQNMSFDASGNERTISLKIATYKENGFLHTYFEIFDSTSPADIYHVKYSIDWRGTINVYLDDRTVPYKELVTLTITPYGDGDANITLRPTNNASVSIKTSLNALLKELASQAVYGGQTMNVGGRDFYILGQGGTIGSLLFFPPEIKNYLENGSVNDLMPKLVSNVDYLDSNHQTQYYMNSDLGEVNGTHYHLEYDGSFWVAKPGRGEMH